jgi:Domain of unknown function (DUF4157)
MSEQTQIAAKASAQPHVVPKTSAFVQRKCACGGSSGLTGFCSECEKNKLLGKPMQTKLRINESGDEYEKEADRAAEQVMRMPEPGKQTESTTPTPFLQRTVSSASSAGIGIAPPIVHEVLSSPGQPLDAASRTFFEPRFGHDFSQVRVHTGAEAAASAGAVHARAFTVGKDIVFGVGQYLPESETGRKLLAHELTHTIQQNKNNGEQRSTAAPIGQVPANTAGLERPSTAPMIQYRTSTSVAQRTTPPRPTPQQPIINKNIILTSKVGPTFHPCGHNMPQFVWGVDFSPTARDGLSNTLGVPTMLAIVMVLPANVMVLQMLLSL